MNVAAKLLQSSVVFVSGYPRMSRFNYSEIINNNISIHCNVNTNDGDLGSLRHLSCALTDARAARPRVCQASSEQPGNDASCFPGNSSPVPKLVAISSFFCVSGICDFVVSTFFVMKSKWYPICLGENVQTTAKLYVVKKKPCNLFAVNTALNDRVRRKCSRCSLPVYV